MINLTDEDKSFLIYAINLQVQLFRKNLSKVNKKLNSLPSFDEMMSLNRDKSFVKYEIEKLESVKLKLKNNQPAG